MRLDPAVKKEAEAKLGRVIPEPDEPEFYRLVEEIRAEDPELADALERGIQFEQVKPPEEEVEGEVKKRAFLRDLKNRLFMRYDELSREWVPSRPKQIMWGVAGFMAIPVLMWAMNNLGGSPSRQAETPPAVATKAQTSPASQSQAPVPEGPREGQTPDLAAPTTTPTTAEPVAQPPGEGTIPPPPTP
ncbi:MAG: hypothetical protein P3W93_008915, partial [Thermus sp.]|nr:hypothetical protein [Thermus sp.]